VPVGVVGLRFEDMVGDLLGHLFGDAFTHVKHLFVHQVRFGVLGEEGSPKA